VFNHGKIEQLDTPRQLYAHPKTEFVARFVGSSNVISGPLAQELAQCAAFSIRPERVRLADQNDGTEQVQLTGELENIQYHGATSRFHVRLRAGQLLIAEIPESPGRKQLGVGQPVALAWFRHDMVVLA
jgi:putative spermidine/putrescine transport system ATP-binding protein